MSAFLLAFVEQGQCKVTYRSIGVTSVLDRKAFAKY